MVAKRDLGFWLSITKEYLRSGIPYVRSFEGLVNLPINRSWQRIIRAFYAQEDVEKVFFDDNHNYETILRLSLVCCDNPVNHSGPR